MARYTKNDVVKMADLIGMAVMGSSEYASKRVEARDYVKKAVKIGGSDGSGTRYVPNDKASVYNAGKGSRYAIAFLYGMGKATDGIAKLGTTLQAEEIDELINATMGNGRSDISEAEFDGMAARGAAYMKRFKG